MFNSFNCVATAIAACYINTPSTLVEMGLVDISRTGVNALKLNKGMFEDKLSLFNKRLKWSEMSDSYLEKKVIELAEIYAKKMVDTCITQFLRNKNLNFRDLSQELSKSGSRVALIFRIYQLEFDASNELMMKGALSIKIRGVEVFRKPVDIWHDFTKTIHYSFKTTKEVFKGAIINESISDDWLAYITVVTIREQIHEKAEEAAATKLQARLRGMRARREKAEEAAATKL